MAKDRDNLAEIIADSLNNSVKGHKVAYFLDDEESPSQVKHWVSTGSTLLDLQVSNRKDGGLPVGKIVEFNGLEGSGKSLLASHLLANTQKMGGVAVYIDTENAVDFKFLETIGIDRNGDFLYVSEHRLETIFQLIEKIIAKVKESKKENKFVTIVVDSIAGATTSNEIEGEYDKEGWNTDKAIVLSKAMRKITGTIGREQVLLVFTNQLRTNLGVMFGDKWTTSGGKAIPFHSSVRVRMRSTKKITEKVGGQKKVVGVRLRPHIIKNRLAPPEQQCEFDLFFNSGIDDIGSWRDVLKDYNLIKHKGGGWFDVFTEDEDGNKVPYYLPEERDKDEPDQFKFRTDDGWYEALREYPAFKQDMYDLVAKKMIVNYENDWVDRSNVEYEDAVTEDQKGD